jgi:hypothetical protein
MAAEETSYRGLQKAQKQLETEKLNLTGSQEQRSEVEKPWRRAEDIAFEHIQQAFCLIITSVFVGNKATL